MNVPPEEMAQAGVPAGRMPQETAQAGMTGNPMQAQMMNGGGMPMQQPAERPMPDGRAVRTGDEEAAYNLGARMGAQALADSLNTKHWKISYSMLYRNGSAQTMIAMIAVLFRFSGCSGWRRWGS